MILLTERPTPGTLNNVQGDRGWAALDGRDNALNAVRLVLAGLVVLGHSWEIGYGQKPPINGVAGHAVEGFFVLSGYLIASSRDRSSAARFLWRRLIRILPGLWACLLVTAFVIAPVVAADGYDVTSAASYVESNWLLQMGQTGIGGTLSGHPVPGQWNGSLWTLAYEFGCYLGLCAIFSAKQARATIVGAILLAATVLPVMNPPIMEVFAVAHGVRLAGFFAAGALFFLLREQIRLSVAPALASSLAVIAAGASLPEHLFWAAAPLPMAYTLLWVGAAWRTRMGRSNDISYGMYIYAFPVQQSLVALGVTGFVPPAGFVACSLAATLPLAWASWLLVERPAMRLSRHQEPSSRHDPTTRRLKRPGVSPSVASRQAAGS